MSVLSHNLRHKRTGCKTARAGQAYVETAIAIMLISFLFLGLFQLSQAFAAREILYHAAHRAARARTVGFNRWMVRKSMRVAAIPNSGAMLVPERDPGDGVPIWDPALQTHGGRWDHALRAWPSSPQGALERARIPFYLGSDNAAQAAHILDYADWPTLSLVFQDGPAIPESGAASRTLEARVRQRFPLRIPMHRAFYDASEAALSGRVEIENHFPLYLDDRNW